jgi:hypothetical protein
MADETTDVAELFARLKGGPLKGILRRLMRWYVEPAFADQRAFNDAVLKLVDDLDERISRLETK